MFYMLLDIFKSILLNLDLDWCSNYESIRSHQMIQYLDIASRFNAVHLNPLNIALHMVSTPLGIVGALSLLGCLTKGSTATSVLCITYILSLLRTLPVGVFLGMCSMTVICGWAAHGLDLSVKVSCFFIIVGYLLQDLSHLATSEDTFQSSYSDGGSVSAFNKLQSGICM